MNRTIETERLILRLLTIDDAADVFEWTGDPIVNRYILQKCGFQFDKFGQYDRYDGSETYDATFLSMHLDKLPY